MKKSKADSPIAKAMSSHPGRILPAPKSSVVSTETAAAR